MRHSAAFALSRGSLSPALVRRPVCTKCKLHRAAPTASTWGSQGAASGRDHRPARHARHAAATGGSEGGGGPAPIAPADQVSTSLMDSMRANIGEALEAQKVSVTDMYGDGRHVSIEVVSGLFDGKSQMQRQRMVYKAIWMELQETVHAVDSMVTLTPAEAGL